MAMKRCPGCGLPYNGKKCSSCLYEPFDSGIQSSSGQEWGSRIPSLPARDPRRSTTIPQWQKQTAPRRRRPTRKKSFRVNLVVILIALSLFPTLMGMLISLVEEVSTSFVFTQEAPAPEPEPPKTLTTLYSDENVLLQVDWSPEYPIMEDLILYAQNTCGEELVLCSSGAAVNGCMVDDSVFFWCEVPEGEQSTCTLWVDPQALEEMGISYIYNLQLNLEVYTSRDYETLVFCQPIRLVDAAPGAATYVEELDASGQVLQDSQMLLLTYQGVDLTDSGSLRLRFYAENKSDRYLNITSLEDIVINSQNTNTYLWQNFLPNTKGVFFVELYDPENYGISGPEDVSHVEFALDIWDSLDPSYGEQTDPIVLNAAEIR